MKRSALLAFYAAALLVLGFWYGQRHASDNLRAPPAPHGLAVQR